MDVADENGPTKKDVDDKKKTEFYCKICDKYYASYKSFGNHTRSYHSSNKEKAQCSYCGNCFTRKDNLQQHIRLFHSSVQAKFSCKYCGETFESRSPLSKHKQICAKKSSYNKDEPRKGQFEVKTIILYTPGPANSVKLTLPPKPHLTTVKSSYNEISDSEPRKKRRRKPSRTFFLSDNNNNDISISDQIEPDTNFGDNKALDCNICNTTFLSEKDYISHKPFCEEGKF